MDANFWKEKWKNQEIQFHQNQFHTKLIQFGKKIKNGKVLVPLCGKTLDMLWLREQGHPVVGVELSPIACESFFQENGLKYVKKEVSRDIMEFKGEGIQLMCGDFFQMPSTVWENVAAIYDRAACIALPTDLRKKYVEVIKEKTRELGSEIFLVAIDYESPSLIGPPFSVPHKEISSLYGDDFKVELLDRHRDESLSGRPPKFSDIEVHESIYFLTR